MSLTVNLYYRGQNGSARKFAAEMEESGVASAIRAEEGNLRYELLISQDFTTQTIRLTDFLPAVFLLCMTFQKREDLSFSSGTFI
ncbi:hypothetical protein LOB78_09305, partial [Lactobacillus delbrueckii subsp. lactis]|nr:hypothetical protein [Lactobacillus delbrueckii subsp. lactis]MCD5509288.1 hypothetical protein [Lactobacillus delbrueckii subsp. lactis]MCD5511132.1 hypothetical protein [Lactobacillus delbrueckii subsp. lactis]MCD5512988.1 hypothetical protein [Lactobacillus delbrueckii subsp. lactis]